MLTYDSVEFRDEARDLSVVPVSVARLVLQHVVRHVAGIDVVGPRHSDRCGHDITDPH